MGNLIGKTIGKFEIKERVGEGGMATVYKAFDPTLQRTVAVKTLLPSLAANSELVQRFHREAVTAANLKHSNIVVIYEVGSFEGQNYIVMEFLEGVTLRQEIRRLGTLPLPRICKILSQLADALDYAHSHGLIHRDIKPGNIILGDGDHATLTDFGLVKASSGARLTQTGTAVGTLEYMSPEQVTGDELDYRSDIYSLGVVVYETLVGRVPYKGRTPFEMLHGLVYEPPIPLCEINPDISPQVEQVVLKALAKRPEERYHSAGELAETFERVVTPAPTTQETAWLLRAEDGREHPLHEGENSVGRVADNDLVIAEAPVSRCHAKITCAGLRCEVVDLGSTNGTYVNDERVEPGEARLLMPGDKLCLGTVCFEAVYSSSSEEDDFRDKTMLVDFAR
jgi:serine/threonine protein kinase